MSKHTVHTVQKEIEKRLVEAKEISKRHKEQDNEYSKRNSAMERVRHLEMVLDFLDLGCTVEEHPAGILVNSKFVLTTHTNKWRIAGKNVWYKFSNPQAFYEKYLLKDFIRSTYYGK